MIGGALRLQWHVGAGPHVHGADFTLFPHRGPYGLPAVPPHRVHVVGFLNIERRFQMRVVELVADDAVRFRIQTLPLFQHFLKDFLLFCFFSTKNWKIGFEIFVWSKFSF